MKISNKNLSSNKFNSNGVVPFFLLMFCLLQGNSAVAEDAPYIIKQISFVRNIEAINDTPIVVGLGFWFDRSRHNIFESIYDINDSNQMVGYDKTTLQAIMINRTYFGEDPIPLGTIPDGGRSVALSINNLGMVVGYADNSGGNSRAFWYVNGQMQNFMPNWGVSSKAHDINDEKVIVGEYTDSEGGKHAFFWRNNRVEVIKRLEATNSIAKAINKNNQITGHFTAENGENHAFLYDVISGDFVDLNGMDALGSEAYDINNNGQVVGRMKVVTQSGAEEWRGFLYEKSEGMVDVNSLLPASSGWTGVLSLASAINNKGEIAGHGFARSGSSAISGYVLSNVTRMSSVKFPDLIESDSRLLGQSISSYGDIVVVGAPTTPIEGKTNTGVVYVYKMQNGVLVNQHVLNAGELGANADNFGASVSIYQDTIAVSADTDSENGTNSGAVYIYKYTASGWGISKKVNGRQGQRFGSSIDLNSNKLVVGAPFVNSSTGAVFLLSRNENDWMDAELLASGMQAGDLFGTSVSLNENNLVIGVPGENLEAGAVYVYNVGLDSRLSFSNKLVRGSGKGFGNTVDVNNGSIIVADTNRFESSAYIYSYHDGNWKYIDTLSIISSSLDRISRVSIDGDIASIGILKSSSSVVEIYLNNGLYWDGPLKLVSNAEGFTGLVHVDHGNVFVGAPGFSSIHGRRGAVSIYSVCAPKCFGQFSGDLTLSATPFPDPVPASGEISYQLEVTNSDSIETASLIALKSKTSEGSSYLQSKSSDLCTGQSSSMVFCEINNLLPGDVASITLTYQTPMTAGTIVNNIDILNIDSDVTNNSKHIETDIVADADTFVEINAPKQNESIVIIDGESVRLNYNSNAWPLGADENQKRINIYLDNQLKVTRYSTFSYKLGTLNSGPHSVRIDVVDFNNNVIDSDEVIFDVVVLYPAVNISQPPTDRNKAYKRTIDGHFLETPQVVFTVDSWTMASGDTHLLYILSQKTGNDFIEIGRQELFTTDPVDLGELGDGEYRVSLSLVDVSGNPVGLVSSTATFSVTTVEPSVEISSPNENTAYAVSFDGSLTATVNISHWLGVNGNQFFWSINGEQKGSGVRNGGFTMPAHLLDEGANALSIVLARADGEVTEYHSQRSFTVTISKPDLNILSPVGRVSEAAFYPLRVNLELPLTSGTTLRWLLNGTAMGEVGSDTAISHNLLLEGQGQTLRVELVYNDNGKVITSAETSFNVRSVDEPANKSGGGSMGLLFNFLIVSWWIRQRHAS